MQSNDQSVQTAENPSEYSNSDENHHDPADRMECEPVQPNDESTTSQPDKTPDQSAGGRLILPDPADEVSDEEAADLLLAVRRFHLGEPGGGEALQRVSADHLPILLHSYRGSGPVRHEYPLFLYPIESIDPEMDGGDDQANASQFFSPLSDLLQSLVNTFAPGPDESRILKDNLVRIEREVHDVYQGMSERSELIDGIEILKRAGQPLESKLGLTGDNAQQFRDDLDRLISSIPAGGQLLFLGESVPLHLLTHVLRYRAAVRQSILKKRINELRSRLHDRLLLVSSQGVGDDSDSVSCAMSDQVNTEALAQGMGQPRGSVVMDADRRAHLEKLEQQLSQYLSSENASIQVHVIGEKDGPISKQSDDVQWYKMKRGDSISAAAITLFDEIALKFTDLFKAIRAAKLELADAFDPVRHGILMKRFDWESFSADELLCLPPILAVENASQSTAENDSHRSRLQQSGRPVSVLIQVDPATNPGWSDGQEPPDGWRYEAGYQAMSHRESLVCQSSTARPAHLTAGFLRTLESARTSLHIVSTDFTNDDGSPSLDAWFHAASAIESRAHPLFVYDPDRGTSLAARFDLSANPKPDQDWPSDDRLCHDANDQEQTLSPAFTFADFCLLDTRYHEHFRIIPDRCVSDRLIPVEDVLNRPIRDVQEYVPYLWVADAAGRMQRGTISRRLLFLCRDRVSFWKMLQELAGINNEHVREAVENERERLTNEFDTERQQINAAHTAEVEQVRTEAVGQAMEQLARSLMNLDPGSLSGMTGGAVGAISEPASVEVGEAPTATEEPIAVEEEPAVETDDDDDGPEEPWIDSVLCTTCNDCMGINPQVFVYNASKQATIGDPKAGTYKHIVEAAEKCPSRCIHPGKPMNPDEPDLDPLIERASKFQ